MSVGTTGGVAGQTAPHEPSQPQQPAETPQVTSPGQPAPPRRRPAWWLLGVLALLVLAVAGWLVWNNRTRGPQYGVAIDAPAPAEDFTLSSSLDQPVSLTDFRGKTVLLYFGYTTCPDVCPTTLADLKQALKELGGRRDQVQVLFVSVDPERDTAQRLAAYLKFFDPSFIGLTGTVAEIEAIASRFGVVFRKETANSAADYLMEHTSAVLALDAEGRLRELFPYGVTGQQIAADVSQLLR